MSTATPQGEQPVQSPASAEPEAQPKPKPKAMLASTRPRSIAMRALLIASGAGLVIGFFMPWIKLGGLASISGFGLMLADGDVVNMISGAHRFLLFAVPLFGVALLVGGISGHRIAVWLALAAGIAVIGDGLATLIMLFIGTTGLGMWLVIVSAFMALGIGLLGVAGRRGH